MSEHILIDNTDDVFMLTGQNIEGREQGQKVIEPDHKIYCSKSKKPYNAQRELEGMCGFDFSGHHAFSKFS